MRIFIVRHADPDYPNNTITPAGHLEAKALSQRMKRQGLDRVYTSPLGRAMDTARYTVDALGLEPLVEPWTAEVAHNVVTVSPWGELCLWDAPGEIIRSDPEYLTADRWYAREPFNSPLFRQTTEEVARHSDAFLRRHGYERDGGRYRIVQPNREKVAVFCHGGFGLWWLAHLLEVPLLSMFAAFFLPPSSVTTVLMEERSGRWAVPRCLGVGDISHLYHANLPMSQAGIKANCE